MIYQVMLQTSQGWAMFRQPTRNADDARQLARLAAESFPGMQARILTADTDGELEWLCTQWQRDRPGRVFGPTPGAILAAPATPEQWHALMNALELGSGGDHDAPYLYQPPAHVALAAAWLHLAARVARGEVGGAWDGAASVGGLASAA